MAGIRYESFDLRIGRREGRKFPTRVVASPAGEAAGDFILPFTDAQIERIIANIRVAILRSQVATRRVEPPEIREVRSFGATLFRTVFNGQIKSCFDASLRMMIQQETGLRIKLRIDAPELTNLPWEYLYSDEGLGFLSLSARTPIVRYIELPYPTIPLEVETPLSILVMVSSPSDYPPLDVEHERGKINSALAELEQQGTVRVETLPEASLAALQSILRKRTFHILHYIGHGDFDELTEDGILVLEDETGKGRPISGSHLGTLLHDHFSMRLVVLNSCEGARSSRADPFASTAATLIRAGIPAVVAMQFEITDTAAIAFAKEFYLALVDNYPLDAAVPEARKAIHCSINNTVEWGTPVIHMRASDGVIFSFGRAQLEVKAMVQKVPIQPSEHLLVDQAAKKQWVFDAETGDLWIGGKEVFLSRLEAKTLAVLFAKKGRTCSKDELAENVWGSLWGVTEEMIRKVIKRLRQKIEPDPRAPKVIITVRGRGYRLDWPERTVSGQ